MTIRIPVWLCCLALLCHAMSGFSMLQMEPIAGGTNSLTVEEPAGSPVNWVAFEVEGLSLFDRIELRLPGTLGHAAVSHPPGWVWQSATHFEGEESWNVITYFFSGLDTENAHEMHSFATPANFSFLANSLDENTVGTMQIVDITLFASVISPDFGIIPAIHRDSFGILISAVPEPGTPLLLAIGGLVAAWTLLKKK